MLDGRTERAGARLALARANVFESGDSDTLGLHLDELPARVTETDRQVEMERGTLAPLGLLDSEQSLVERTESRARRRHIARFAELDAARLHALANDL